MCSVSDRYLLKVSLWVVSSCSRCIWSAFVVAKLTGWPLICAPLSSHQPPRPSSKPSSVVSSPSVKRTSLSAPTISMINPFALFADITIFFLLLCSVGFPISQGPGGTGCLGQTLPELHCQEINFPVLTLCYPLFRVRSWNNGRRCMSLYILIKSYTVGDTAHPHTQSPLLLLI